MGQAATKSRIERLTAQQEAALPGFRDHGLAYGLSTLPCDRAKAEAAMTAHYAALGRPEPRIIIWLDSPHQGLIAAALLSGAAISGKPVGAQVGAQVWDQVGAQVGDLIYRAGYGSMDMNWAAWARAHAANGVVLPASAHTLIDICESCGWWWPFENAVVITERPRVINRDASHRLHSLTGPAIAYADGWAIHAVAGVRVPAWIIERPQDITPAKIKAERNAEVRRVMIRVYGLDRYMTDVGATVIDQAGEDDPRKGLRTGRLCRVTDDEGSWHFIDVLNSTPEPDGTTKRYQMIVNGDHYDGQASRSLLAAWASTYRDPRDPARLAFAKPEQALFAVET